MVLYLPTARLVVQRVRRARHESHAERQPRAALHIPGHMDGNTEMHWLRRVPGGDSQPVSYQPPFSKLHDALEAA